MSAGGSLPDEIIREIHSRLPTKSLGRFRCVSKSWQTLISDPKFAKPHLIRNNRHRRPKVLLSYGQFFDVVDVDGEPCVSSSKIDSAHEWICLYGSCDGLILALAQNYQLFLLNPTTQECKKLPNSDNVDFDSNIACGLGYDSTSDDYKVVIFDFGVVNVYSLRSDAWKTFQASLFDNDAAILKRCPGIFMNGSIHWFCFLPSSVTIVAFDLADEKFKNVPLPRLYHPLAHQQLCLSLYEVGGCLCFLDDFQEIEVWVMKDYGVESSWIKFCGVTKWDVNWVHQFFEARNHVRPIFYLPDEELVFVQDAIHGIKVITYDVKEKTSWNFKLVHKFDLMCTFEDSLVSPEQFSRATSTFLH